jgi:hypothetical protein
MQRAKPIVLDPGLYLSKKFDLTMTTERSELPTSFKLFTGRPGPGIAIYFEHKHLQQQPSILVPSKLNISISEAIISIK